jgi:hypothetical protein
MQPEDRDSIEWKARIFKDKALIPQIEEELRVLVQVILGEKRTLSIEHYKDRTYADGETRLFDPYPTCKSNLKQWCNCKGRAYQGYIKPDGYMFMGDSRVDIYCQIISRFIGEPRLVVPFSY